MVLLQLEGSDQIPVMEEDQSDEDKSKDWIIRPALGRVDRVNNLDFGNSAGTVQLCRGIEALH